MPTRSAIIAVVAISSLFERMNVDLMMLADSSSVDPTPIDAFTT